MLLINRIKNSTQLSDTESKIAQYILENPQLVTQLTIHELSETTYASASTITRFCRKMKTEGFSDFKVKLASELSSFSITENRIRDDVPFKKNQTSAEIVQSILSLNYQSMNDTYNNMDLEQLDRIAHKIYHTPHIYLYGSGQSLILAQDFQYKLFRIELDCNLETSLGFQSLKANTQPLDSIALIISYYGQNEHNKTIVDSLVERNIPYILITGPLNNPLCTHASEVVHVSPQEELVTKMASFSSRTSMQLVLDFIYALIFAIDYEKNQKIIEKHPWYIKKDSNQ
ncbi:MurR/RpiR family transcriptional regulator [Erysipelothrix rhusiopathiae]|nr:MurR/RpiR family transcriptional regulator [Erysipelothrix rhusiopathiae]